MSAAAPKVAPAAADDADGIFPLSTWTEFVIPTLSDDKIKFERNYRESIIRRTTVAYGIVELLKRSNILEDEEIRIDNFVVTVSKKPTRTWDDTKGVGMISSGLSLTIEEPSYVRGLLEVEEDCDDGHMGRCLEVELTSAVPQETSKTSQTAAAFNRDENLAAMDVLAAVAEESNRCHLFARLLYELFTCEPLPTDALDSASIKEPPQKRLKSYDEYLTLSRSKGGFEMAEIPFQIPCIVHMHDLGVPASICLMTQNLLEYALRGDGRQSDDAYESLWDAGKDLHLLLLDPDRFLFENDNQDTDDVQLLYRTGKLYGRHKEKTLIADAFCRVSQGKSEAFFIGGFSGSGKSMLVNSLRDTVNTLGGYVIKHKFDPMPREKPLSGVISAFNQVCLMIKVEDRPMVTKKLRAEFGVDFNLLLRLLPNVSVLFPELVSPALRVEAGEAMNARSVCFTLLRFVRVVSSPRHPVMLFLDDIQLADSTALDVIHAILSDMMGSCMFFVGTYRDNEVQIGHDIFDLMERLEISNVQTTTVYLAGLDQEDLNTMISDALCLYPRICKSLSNILFQKTKGNPFFTLEFMQSLTIKSRGLLQYNFHQKRWVWNEDIIRAEDITDNVLHLLSSKMNGLSDDVQLLLKVMACFGSSTNESVIGYLIESDPFWTHAGFVNGLKVALSDGFIVEDEKGSLHFVHDKVREAAYNIIPDSDKKQFHYRLGKELHSYCDGKDVGDTIFLIANQINHGKEWIVRDTDLSIAIAELNMKAGKMALDGCDHKTAYSYFGVALSLLPNDHWSSHYDLSLRLYFLKSSAANSICQYYEAELFLRMTLEKARCLDDQLPSYLLLSQILQAQGKVNDVYDLCSNILTELGESIPVTYTLSESSEMQEETLKMYEEVGDKWLKGEKTVDKTLQTTLQFYNVIALASYFCKSYSTTYFTCKAMQLSLQRGLCDHTPLALIQFTTVLNKDENAMLCYRIAKDAMSLRERFDVAAQIPELYFNFYGRIAWRFEPFQTGIGKLRQGFEAGLSSGHADMGLHCAIQVIKTTILSGANLSSILKEIDYYLHLLKTYKSEVTRNFLHVFRETVSLLIDNGEATSTAADPCIGVGDLNDQNRKLRDAVLQHSVIRCYWSGHNERSRNFGEKCKHLFGQGRQSTSYIAQFFYGLNAIDLINKRKQINKSKEVIQAAIDAMKYAAANSAWNFTNKLCLLEAEQLAWTRTNHDRASILYEASIKSAKRSGFVHEQGLACEKAAFYFKRDRNNQKVREYFQQALECYQVWGSSIKVAFIQTELDRLNPDGPRVSE